MLSAMVTVTLDQEADDLDRADREALQCLAQVPDGARLVVNVGDRELLMPSAVSWLSAQACRLNVEISASTPSAARRWYDAIKSGRVA